MMMKQPCVRLITTGDKNCLLFNEYLKRLSIDNVVLPGKLMDEAYTKKVLPLLLGHVVTLEVKGQQYTSEDFAVFFDRLRQNNQHITLICGPSNGIPAAIQERTHSMLSLGKMTLPHELARIILIEQLYRAHQILAGHPYHK